MRVGAVEDNGVGGERVERRRRRGFGGRIRARVRRQVRGTQPVNRDEHDGPAHRGRLARVPPAGERRSGDGDDDQRGDERRSPLTRGGQPWVQHARSVFYCTDPAAGRSDNLSWYIRLSASRIVWARLSASTGADATPMLNPSPSGSEPATRSRSKATFNSPALCSASL